MSDTTLNRIVSSGTQAQRLAFTPSPATPASGPNPLYIWNETDTGAVYHSPNGAAWVRAGPTVAEMNAAIAASSGSGGTVPDGVASGCGVVYSGTGLTFNMSAGSFYLDSTLLTATAQSVTLAAADATNPRIDVLYVDSSGTFGKITGTAAASPSQPTVDPTTQLYLTFVTVPATATSISGITNENIYLEGVEWTATTSGSGFTVNSTNNPFAGTKDIEGTAVTAGSYVKLVRSSSIAYDGNGNLTLEIRSKAAWATSRWLTLQWYLAGVAKGSAVSLKTGTFGFNSSFISGYQLIIINKNQFAVPAGVNVDELRIVDVGGSIGFYLDNIILQNTGTSAGSSTGTASSIASLSTGVSTVDSGQSTSLSQVSSSLSGAISSTSSLSTAVSTVDSNQSTSLSRISSSLSGAISSTSSLSTAVSTVISGSTSTVNSRIDSLSTAGGGGGSTGTPTIRASSITSSSNNSYAISWPAGTIAGDVVIIFCGHGFIINRPTGWSELDNSQGSNWNGATFAKVMTSGDISTGSVTLTTTGTFNGVFAAVTITTATMNVVRAFRSRREAGLQTDTDVSLTDGALASTDLILAFASNRQASANTISNFTSVQAINAAAASAILAKFTGTMNALGVTEFATFSVAGSGYYNMTVALRGV